MAMTLQTILLTVAFIVLWALPATAEQALPEDRAVIAACLAAVAENITRQGPGDLSDEAPGIAGRLAAAARDSQRKASSCIGAVLVPCFQKPDVLSTAAMLECSSRELEVWDEQLNAAYKAALAEASPATEKALREAQRAWITWRDLRCKLPALEQDGGSMEGTVTIDCLRTVTAAQAILLMGQE
jgi:uncharacterized protein YecT (DUF1311 family)